MFSLNMIFVIVAVVTIALIALVLVLRVVRARKDRAPALAPAAAADDESVAAGAKPSGHTGLAGYSGSLGYTGPADDAEPSVEAEPTWEATSAAIRTGAPPIAISEMPLTSNTDAKPPALKMSQMDPVLVLVKSLLQDSGELNHSEFRRLELYLPQRIVDAVDTLAPQMTGRANESKRSRLQRIRQYASSLMAAFDREERDFIPENVVMPKAATVEPVAIGGSFSDTAQVLPPEDWGTSVGGSELALDPELSLLHDELSPAPETDEGPAPEPESTPAPELEEILEVVPEQGANDLASMSPQELGRALAFSDDVDFKKAVIDVLENLATPEALSQLQLSLDDPNPDVQLHALSAVDRILSR